MLTRTQEFILKNKKVLTSGANFFNPDTSLMSIEDYYKAKCRILVIFPTPATVKAVSSTAAALNDFVITRCKDTFIDFAYMPENEDIKRYDEWNVPYAIGNVTHFGPDKFDMIGFSISVLNEVVTAPVMLSTFSRCDKPIPLFWSQRKDAKLGEYPIIYAGGITAVCGESMFGKVTIKGKEEQAYLDFMTLGDCGHNNHLTNRFIEAIATGKASRKQEDHDVPGYPHSDIPNFEEVVEVKTIQDYVEALFDLQEIYQPQAYDVEYNKHNQIIKNIKINPKARDFVTPYYPHIMEPDLGIGRAIINANGANCGTAQSACSEGCSAAGSCSFCAEGNYTGGFVQKTKEQILDDLWECKKYSASYKYKPYSFNCIDKDTIVPTSEGFKFASELTKESRIYSDYGESSELSQLAIFEGERLQLRTQQGPWFTATPNHRHFVLREDGIHEILLGALKEGDYIPYLVGYKEPIVAVLDDYYKLGLWYGDGFYSGNSSYQYVAVQEKKLLDYVIANTDHEVERRKESYRAFMWSHTTTTWFKSICPNKEDLTWLTSLTLSQSLSFIRGLFDSDGCGSGGYLKITQKSSRRLLLQWCSTVLGSIGIRTRLSKDMHVTLNDKDFYRSDLYVIGRESRELFLTYVGSSIDSKIADVKSAKTKWSDKDKCIPPEFGIWTYNCLKSAGLHKGHNSYKFFNGLRGMLVETFLQKFGSFDIEPVALIKRGVRFSKIEQITSLSKGTVIDVVESTTGKFLAGGFITHNTNYLEDYKGMLAEFIKIYPKVTFINMRMEELGRDVDALHMMKLIGSNRISAPMEGLSPRIQNNLLNKCLSEEALNNFMDDMVHAKLTDIKVGGIFTGYEEDIDFQWICDFVDKFKKRAASEGGNFPFRLKCTPLVHYPLTPIEYLERKSAKKSFLGEHWLTDEWYEKFREHQVFFKVNGFRYSTFLEQTFVDLGRSLTPLVYKHFVSTTAPIYSLRSCATDEYLADLRSMIDADVYFNDRDPEHYISPNHRIHIELMGSYIPRARRLLRHKKAGNIFDNEPDIRCLRTFEGAKVKCYHTCIVKDPLKIYNDVTMDEEGNLHGDFVDLTGCQRCPTPQHRLQRLKRPIIQTKNSDDIIATPRIPQVQKIRFVLKRSQEYDCLNPNNIAHTFLTKFLQLSDTLLHSYHSMVCHNMFWQANEGFKFFTAGYQVVDTMWSKNSIKEIRELIPEVNKHLKSCQVITAQDVLRDEKILITDINFYTFESTLPRELFDAAGHTYKGQIKVEAQVQGFALTEIEDSSLQAPVFASKGGKTVGCFWIPTKYNPVTYLMSYLSQAKKTSEDGVVTTTEFACQMTMRESKMPCKCGKEKALISVTTGKPMSFGRSCLVKAILTQMIK